MSLLYKKNEEIQKATRKNNPEMPLAKMSIMHGARFQDECLVKLIV